MAATGFAAASLGIAGYSAYKSATAPKPKAPVLPQLPVKDDRPAVLARELSGRQAAIQQMKKGTRSTVLTSPQGIQGVAAPGQQTLVGL